MSALNSCSTAEFHVGNDRHEMMKWITWMSPSHEFLPGFHINFGDQFINFSVAQVALEIPGLPQLVLHWLNDRQE